MSVLKVRKAVSLFVWKGDISIVSVRKDVRLLKEQWTGCTEGTRRYQVNEGTVENYY